MASRIFRFAESANPGTGESEGGGASNNFLVYQTSDTPPSTIVGGASVGAVMGPDEVDACIVASANNAVNSAGANGVTYDVEFYGSATDTEVEQLTAINAAIGQANADGVDIAELDAYPYGGGDSAAFAAAQINNANTVPIIVIIDGTVTS